MSRPTSSAKYFCPDCGGVCKVTAYDGGGKKKAYVVCYECRRRWVCTRATMEYRPHREGYMTPEEAYASKLKRNKEWRDRLRLHDAHVRAYERSKRAKKVVTGSWTESKPAKIKKAAVIVQPTKIRRRIEDLERHDHDPLFP